MVKRTFGEKWLPGAEDVAASRRQRQERYRRREYGRIERERRIEEANRGPVTPRGVAAEDEFVRNTMAQIRRRNLGRSLSLSALQGANVGASIAADILELPSGSRAIDQVVGGAIGAAVGLAAGAVGMLNAGDPPLPPTPPRGVPPPPLDTMDIDTEQTVSPTGVMRLWFVNRLIDIGRRNRKKHKRRAKTKEDLRTWHLKRKRQGVRKVLKK